MLKEMEEARQAQFQEKERRLGEQAKQERDEFKRIIQKQKEQEEADRKLEEEMTLIRKKHSEQLRAQIQQNEEKKKQDRLDYLEEGRKIRQRIDDENNQLEQIKHKKLKQLNELNIDPKYQAELARKKVAPN